MIKPVDDGNDTTTDAGTREYPIKEYYDTIVPLLRSIDDTDSPACILKRRMTPTFNLSIHILYSRTFCSIKKNMFFGYLG